jgi:hypothetical protein
MRYDAEWGVGSLIVLVAGLALWSVLESEASIKRRLLLQKEAEERAKEKSQ